MLAAVTNQAALSSQPSRPGPSTAWKYVLENPRCRSLNLRTVEYKKCQTSSAAYTILATKFNKAKLGTNQRRRFKSRLQSDVTEWLMNDVILSRFNFFFTSESMSRSNLKKVNVLPTESFKEHPSIPYWLVSSTILTLFIYLFILKTSSTHIYNYQSCI